MCAGDFHSFTDLTTHCVMCDVIGLIIICAFWIGFGLFCFI